MKLKITSTIKEMIKKPALQMEAVYKLKGKQKVQITNGLTLLFKCLASQM